MLMICDTVDIVVMVYIDDVDIVPAADDGNTHIKGVMLT